eukprot:364590-Chlamydomonas_euryale.AAC.9
MRPSSSVPTSPSTSTSMWPHCRSCDFSASVTTLCSMLAACMAGRRAGRVWLCGEESGTLPGMAEAATGVPA